MMRKPWQIWIVFLTCLVGVGLAMSWLSLKITQLDKLRETDRTETELARQEAELQERISSALYRMDLLMLPLIAQEAARPHYLYQSFYQVLGPTGSVRLEDSPSDNGEEGLQVPSPLLFQPAEFVVLHFQIRSDNSMSSPEIPHDAELRQAIDDFGILPATIELASTRLQRAQTIFSFDPLLEKCAEINLPLPVSSPGISQNIEFAQTFYNVPAVEKFREQNKRNARQSDSPSSKPGVSNKIEMQRSRGEERVNEEFIRRRDSTQELAGQNWASNSFGYGKGIGFGNGSQIAIQSSVPRTRSDINPSTHPADVRYGVMQPIWVDDQLVLARRVEGPNESVIQCCWLDWDSIQKSLRAEVNELLPNLQFQPITADTELKLGTALTTIPVQLVVDSSNLLSSLAMDQSAEQPAVSGMRLSLMAAWCGLGLAAAASAVLLHGVMRLSERRAAFVSSVTHELRTPLTTFRMYAEMLAEGMVPDDKQRQYAHTLKIQADRLSQLVENVLQFARLERGPSKIVKETVSIEDLVDRFFLRLSERAGDADMQLSITHEDAAATLQITTQPSTVEQILFNLVDNACKYAQPSTRKEIEISSRQTGDSVQLRVRDFGPGIAAQDRKRLFRPFCQSEHENSRQSQGVGLGLAICRRMSASLGGRLLEEPCSDGAIFVLELPVTMRIGA